MNESEAEDLIERSLSAGRPRENFRAELLGDSTAALVRGSRLRARWRTAGLAAVAVLIAAASFLCGRFSASHAGVQAPVIAKSGPGQTETIRVPAELVAWLEAARFFKQLGMQERVTLAYERASRLLPYEAILTSGGTDQMLAAERDATHGCERRRRSALSDGDAESAVESIRRIMAQSLGG